MIVQAMTKTLLHMMLNLPDKIYSGFESLKVIAKKAFRFLVLCENGRLGFKRGFAARYHDLGVGK